MTRDPQKQFGSYPGRERRKYLVTPLSRTRIEGYEVSTRQLRFSFSPCLLKYISLTIWNRTLNDLPITVPCLPRS